MSQSKTFLWYKCFNDDKSVDDGECSGQPSTSTLMETGKVWEVIVGMSYGSVQCTLDIRCTAAKSVLGLLSSDQKEHCVAVCNELKIAGRDDLNFISSYGFIVINLWLSSKHHSGNHQKKHVKFVAMWCLSWLFFFFYIKVIIHK